MLRLRGNYGRIFCQNSDYCSISAFIWSLCWINLRMLQNGNRKWKLQTGDGMKEEKIWLSSPTMHGEELAFVQEAFDRNWIAPLGFNVDNFEKEMAAYLGIGHAAALTSGTAALHLAVKLAGVERGDVVICSDMTFVLINSDMRLIAKVPSIAPLPP